MAMAVMVLMTDRASAPASTQARAMATMSVTLGESLTMTGLRVFSRTASTTAEAAAGSVPKTIPPCLTLGQEMFTSTPATSGTGVQSPRQFGVLLHGGPEEVGDDPGGDGPVVGDLFG